jgi:hypothetical protein
MMTYNVWKTAGFSKIPIYSFMICVFSHTHAHTKKKKHTPIGSMYAIYGNIYHQIYIYIYPSHASIYTSTMDPMGYDDLTDSILCCHRATGPCIALALLQEILRPIITPAARLRSDNSRDHWDHQDHRDQVRRGAGRKQRGVCSKLEEI